MPNQEVEFLSARQSILGARPDQEDFSVIWPDDDPAGQLNRARSTLLAVVSDGMGGHAAGEVASRLAATTFVNTFQDGIERGDVALEVALLASNQAIAKAISNNGQLSGMGCTIVAAYFDQAGLRWSSVGDSKLTLVRQGKVERLNADHSYGAELDVMAANNKISAAAARANPRRGALLSALTGGDLQRRDINMAPVQLFPGDWVLLSTDGMETLTDDDIVSAVGRQLDGMPGHVVNDLLLAVRLRKQPGQDNTTVVAVRVAEAGTFALLEKQRPDSPSYRTSASTGLRGLYETCAGRMKGEPILRFAVYFIGAGAALGCIALIGALFGMGTQSSLRETVPQTPPSMETSR